MTPFAEPGDTDSSVTDPADDFGLPAEPTSRTAFPTQHQAEQEPHGLHAN
jgi:hypothetical protein